MRVPRCIFEREDLVYLRDKLGSLRTRGDCLVFSIGEWSHLMRVVGLGLNEQARTKKRLSLRLCAEFMEQRKAKGSRQTLLQIAESMVRLEPLVAEWMLSKLDGK